MTDSELSIEISKYTGVALADLDARQLQNLAMFYKRRIYLVGDADGRLGIAAREVDQAKKQQRAQRDDVGYTPTSRPWGGQL